MSSMLSSFPNKSASSLSPLDWVAVNTPAYFNNPYDDYIPIPLSVSSEGVLDIINNNDDIDDYINNGTSFDQYINVPVKFTGGSRIVTDIGPNLKRWLANWWGGNPSHFSLYLSCTMTKVQTADPNRNLRWDDVENTNSSPPNSSYTGGDATQNYYSTWLFKTPLTVKTIAGSYITLYSTLSPGEMVYQ